MSLLKEEKEQKEGKKTDGGGREEGWWEEEEGRACQDVRNWKGSVLEKGQRNVFSEFTEYERK